MPLLPDRSTPVSSDALPSDAQFFWQLPPRRLDRLLTLTHQADQVELKLVVPVDAHASVCASLGADLSRASARKVYYLDTADLMLERHGVVARIRSFEDGSGDSVVKLRPISPGDLPPRLRESKRFVVEVDAMPGRFFCTGAMKRRLGMVDVEQALGEGRSLDALFSHRQRVLLAAYAPPTVELDNLLVFGPVQVRRCRVQPVGLDGALTVEHWAYPDGSSILELSTRCRAEVAMAATARVTSVLKAHDINVTGCQQTKTRTTLAYFACAYGGCQHGREDGASSTTLRRPRSRFRSRGDGPAVGE
jgi:hypothetical protein